MVLKTRELVTTAVETRAVLKRARPNWKPRVRPVSDRPKMSRKFSRVQSTGMNVRQLRGKTNWKISRVGRRLLPIIQSRGVRKMATMST